MVRLHRPSLSSLSPPPCPSPPIPMATTDPRTELPCIPLVLSPSPAALLLSATHARTHTHTPYPSSLSLPMSFSVFLFLFPTHGFASSSLSLVHTGAFVFLSRSRLLTNTPISPVYRTNSLLISVAVPCLLLLFLVGPPVGRSVGSNFYSERAIRNGTRDAIGRISNSLSGPRS